MKKRMDRRHFNKIIAITAVAPLASFSTARAGEKEMVDPESEAAQSLQFVSVSDNPAEICGGCNFYSSIDDTETGNCIIFNGATVPEGAYCSAYQAKKTT